MHRRIVLSLIITILLVSILFLTFTLLYGDDGDSKHFSRPAVPEMPFRKNGTSTPEKAGKHSFSDHFMPSPDALNVFNPDFLHRNRKNVSTMPRFFPDPNIHYFILEMNVPKDIDYKIRRIGP